MGLKPRRMKQTYRPPSSKVCKRRRPMLGSRKGYVLVDGVPIVIACSI